jgi:hypothetical protein
MRRIEGTDTTDDGLDAGHIWIDDTDFMYTDESGNIRSITGTQYTPVAYDGLLDEIGAIRIDGRYMTYKDENGDFRRFMADPIDSGWPNFKNWEEDDYIASGTPSYWAGWRPCSAECWRVPDY